MAEEAQYRIRREARKESWETANISEVGRGSRDSAGDNLRYCREVKEEEGILLICPRKETFATAKSVEGVDKA